MRAGPPEWLPIVVQHQYRRSASSILRRRSPNMTAAVEEGLRLWLAREKRKAAKPDPSAKHLWPPSAREIAARKGGAS